MSMNILNQGVSASTNSMTTASDSTVEELKARLAALEERLRELAPDDAARGPLLLAKAQVQIGLEMQAEGWQSAREAFDIFLAGEQWGEAAEACNAMFLAERDESLAALGQGIWLAVTYPVDPAVTLGLLQHVIDETPDDADGAAVAAAVARYIVELRAQGKERENLMFFAEQMLGNVAKRHSEVDSQHAFDIWLQKLELNEPDKFLVRLRNVVDVLVQENWWFDRDALTERLPDH